MSNEGLNALVNSPPQIEGMFRRCDYSYSARSLLIPTTVKTASEDKKSDTDFYLANVAPLNAQQHEGSFRYLDMVLLTVLFLEIGGLIRLLLAK
jgi:hypothetical protein